MIRLTNEEKIRYLTDTSIEDASLKNNRLLDKYKKSLDDEFERYKETVRANRQYSKNSRINSTKQELKKALSEEQTAVKKKLTVREAEIKDEIFAAVNERLNDYRETPEYESSLVKMIEMISEKYDCDDISFSISTNDENLLGDLRKKTGKNVNIGHSNFTGGVKAVIPSRNILIDLSYKSMLGEQIGSFSPYDREALK